MKLTPAVVLTCLLALSAFHSAYAVCPIDDPAAVAKSFYSKHVQFSSENPAKIRTIITSRLFAALDREYKCAQGQICALEADPWTDAQDGDIGKPVEFATATNSGVEATVSMTYPFILDKTHHQQQHVTLFLQRKSPTDCWLLSDLVGPRGESLVQTIEKWHKEFGSGL
jgi:hypothetical protein